MKMALIKSCKLVKSTLNSSKGFTLSELAAVVLIITILFAVAFPKYQKVVEKNRSSEAITHLKTLKDHQAVCYLEKGEDSLICGDGTNEDKNLFTYSNIIEGAADSSCTENACGPTVSNFYYYVSGQTIGAKRVSPEPKYLLLTTALHGQDNRIRCVNQSESQNYCEIIGFTQQEGSDWFQPPF